MVNYIITLVIIRNIVEPNFLEYLEIHYFELEQCTSDLRWEFDVDFLRT